MLRNVLFLAVVSNPPVPLGPLSPPIPEYVAQLRATSSIFCFNFGYISRIGLRYVTVTDYRHCIETQDRHPEGSKMGSTPPYILIADQYYLQITVPISAIYYPIMSYYPHLFCVYIEALELYLQLSRLCNSLHCKAYSYLCKKSAKIVGHY